MYYSTCIANGRMVEVGTNAPWGTLEKFHEGARCAPQVMVRALGLLAAQNGFQIAVQVLVGIGFRRVRRQVERLNRFGALGEPFLDLPSVIHTQVGFIES